MVRSSRLPRAHTASPAARRREEDGGAPPHKSTLVIFAAFCAFVVGAAATLGPAAGLGAVGAVAIGLVILRWPAYGAYTLVALAPALSGLRRGFPVPGFRMSELLVAGIATIILVTAKKAPRWGAFDWMALSYVVATAGLVWLNVIRHEGAFTSDILGTLIGPLQFFLLYRAIVTGLPAPEQRARAIRLVLLVSIPVSLITVMQQYDVGGIRPLIDSLTGTTIYESTVSGVPRATGPFPHWHNLAGYLLLVVLLGLSVVLETGQRIIRKRLLLVVMALALAALLQTASLAPLLGAIGGAFIIGISVGQGRRVLRWLVVIAACGAVLFGPLVLNRVQEQYRDTSVTQDQSIAPQTIAFRYTVWKTQFFPVIEENLVTGYGPTLPPRLYFAYAESLYVTLLLRGGVPLLLVYAGLMAALFARARVAAVTEETERRIVGRVILAAVPLLLVIDTIATYFLDSGPAPLLWTLAGLMAVRASATRVVSPGPRSPEVSPAAPEHGSWPAGRNGLSSPSRPAVPNDQAGL